MGVIEDAEALSPTPDVENGSVEVVRPLEVAEPLAADFGAETTDAVELIMPQEGIQPILEYAISYTDERVTDTGAHIPGELPVIDSIDELPIIEPPKSVESLVSVVDENEGGYPADIEGVRLAKVEGASVLPFETKDEQLHTALDLMIEISDLPRELFETDELAEINQMLETLLIEIQSNIDDLEVDIEDLLTSEAIVEVFAELQAKLGIYFDEKTIRLLIELLVQQYELQATKPEETADIDFLNRMGTREYKTSADRPTTGATLDFGEQTLTTKRLGSMSISLAA